MTTPSSSLTIPLTIRLEAWIGDNAIETDSVTFDAAPIFAAADAERLDEMRETHGNSDWVHQEAVVRGLIDPWSGPFTVDTPEALEYVTNDEIFAYRDWISSWLPEDGTHPTGGYDDIVDLDGAVVSYTASCAHHRQDGPALVVLATGDLHWYRNGKRHRVDGPAVIYGGARKSEWWVDGLQLDDIQEHSKRGLTTYFEDRRIGLGRPDEHAAIITTELANQASRTSRRTASKKG